MVGKYEFSSKCVLVAKQKQAPNQVFGIHDEKCFQMQPNMPHTATHLTMID